MKLETFKACLEYFKPAPTIVIADAEVDIHKMMEDRGFHSADYTELNDNNLLIKHIWEQVPFYVKLLPSEKEYFFKEHLNDEAAISRVAIFTING